MAYLKTLALKNFRNYGSAHIALSPKLNFFIGQNGQGKTNLLEAITLLVAGKSFRTNFLKEIIRYDESAFDLSASYISYEIEHTLRLFYSPTRRELTSNETTYSSFSPLIGGLQGVFFSGYQNNLVKEAPSGRRRFLDFQCAQLNPLYLHHLKRYHQALKARNLLLKQRKVQLLGYYEQLLADSAPYLVLERKKAVIELEELSQEKQKAFIPKKEKLSLIYESSLDVEEPKVSDFIEAYQKTRTKDLRYGHTSIGPHKDDLLILLDNKEAKKFASEGQIQSLIISLYLAEYDRILQQTREKPLFCVDDIGQNLDSARLQSFYEILDTMGQVFITTQQRPTTSLRSDVQFFEIQSGSILCRSSACS